MLPLGASVSCNRGICDPKNLRKSSINFQELMLGSAGPSIESKSALATSVDNYHVDQPPVTGAVAILGYAYRLDSSYSVSKIRLDCSPAHSAPKLTLPSSPVQIIPSA